LLCVFFSIFGFYLDSVIVFFQTPEIGGVDAPFDDNIEVLDNESFLFDSGGRGNIAQHRATL